MPAFLTEWFHQHYYQAVFLATLIEGLGIPLPAEILFLATAALIHQGAASLSGVISAAVAGNVLGTMLGFTLAAIGGKALIQRISRWVRLKPEAVDRVEEFFHRYGGTTVFMSRFIGFIRVATIYSAGPAGMSPIRFFLYTLAAAIIWNTGWAYLAFRFGEGLKELLHFALTRGLIWIFPAVLLLWLGRRFYLWLRTRRPVN